MKLADDLTCAELVTLVTDYAEGALSTHDRQRFEEHVVFCRGCASYLDQMLTTIEVTGRLTEHDLLPEVQEELLHVFRDWKRS